MLSKQNAEKSKNGFPELDEGWWASVLADEEAKPEEIESEPEIKNGVPGTTIHIEWDEIQTIHDNDEVICLQVYNCNRGGLLVQGNNIQGFVPISHLVDFPNVSDDDERKEFLEKYIGREISLKVIECDEELERIVLSERAAQGGKGCRKRIFNELKSGSIVSGQVTNVTEFGVFVDLGGVEGLIHVSELSWGRVEFPGDVLSIGTTVEAMVLSVSEEKERVALSYKRLFDNPWDIFSRNHQTGDVLEANITSVKKFGAFARLDEGIEGLIHISSIPQSGNLEVEEFFTVGQNVNVEILHIDKERRRLGLGLVLDE